MCKVDGCCRNSAYVNQNVCQKHYFRFMRNGTYDLVRTRKYRSQNEAGYQLLYEPSHKLAMKNGYVYEHRMVYMDNASEDVSECALCKATITWDDCHIDHIDEDVSNNRKDNLRALCSGCNVFLGHTIDSMGSNFFEIGGRNMTAFAWARQDGVKVSGSTILRRRRKGRMNDYDCVYSKRVTHHNTVTKIDKKEMKHDLDRGIKVHY